MILSTRQREAIEDRHGRIPWPTKEDQIAAAETYNRVFTALVAGGPRLFGSLVANESAFDSSVAEIASAANQAARSAWREMEHRFPDLIESIREAAKERT